MPGFLCLINMSPPYTASVTSMWSSDRFRSRRRFTRYTSISVCTHTAMSWRHVDVDLFGNLSRRSQLSFLSSLYLWNVHISLYLTPISAVSWVHSSGDEILPGVTIFVTNTLSNNLTTSTGCAWSHCLLLRKVSVCELWTFPQGQVHFSPSAFTSCR